MRKYDDDAPSLSLSLSVSLSNKSTSSSSSQQPLAGRPLFISVGPFAFSYCDDVWRGPLPLGFYMLLLFCFFFKLTFTKTLTIFQGKHHFFIKGHFVCQTSSAFPTTSNLGKAARSDAMWHEPLPLHLRCSGGSSDRLLRHSPACSHPLLLLLQLISARLPEVMPCGMSLCRDALHYGGMPNGIATLGAQPGPRTRCNTS